MLPIKAIRLKIGTLLAADTAYLAAAGGNNLILIKAPFALTEDLAFADITEADFDGYEDVDITAGPQNVAIDPATNQQVILLEHTDPFVFEVTGLTNLPQTIYGFALVNTGGDTLFAAETLATPVTLTEVGHVVTLDNPKITIVSQPLS